MNGSKANISKLVGEVHMGLITPRKSTLARRTGLFWPLFCVLLFLPVTAFAVCGTAPTVSFDAAGKYSAAGESVDYLVSITNNDAGSCDLDLAVSGDAAGFTASLPNGTPLTVAGGATDSTTILRVAVDPGTADWTINTTTLSVDAVDSVATTTVFDNDPLLHNSINLDSTKHSGNWGSTKAGSKYGNFSCQTCHVPGTNNIKRIRTSITTPDPSNGTLPGDGMPISFQSVVDGSADLGDDSRLDKTQSSAICETCHTYDAAGTNGVRYHGYDMSVPGDVGHYNKKDCLLCHPHSAGFKASCASCHGGGTQGTIEANYWPDGSTAAAENDVAGRHLPHIEALAQLLYGLSATGLLNDAAADTRQKALCAYCHDNPGADADHATAGPAEVAMHPAWNVGVAASGSYTTGDGNCTNICHNNKATGVGSFGWLDAGTSTCLMCHNDITVTTAGTTGATHDRHLNINTDFGPTVTCASCHDATTSWAGNVKPASLHIDGTLAASGSRVAADEYTGSSIPGANFGSCSGGAAPNACHNDGSMSAAPARAYVWGSTLTNDCASCHAAVPASGSHPTHVQSAQPSFGGGATWATNASTQTDYDFGCGNCHSGAKTLHLNGTINVGAGFGAPTANQCSSNACHADGQGGAPRIAPTWGTPFVAGACNACHGNFPTTDAHPQHTLEVGFHYDAIYSGLADFLPVVDSDPVPTGLSYLDKDEIRGHGNPALEDATGTAIVSCNTCHNYTVTVKTNDLATYADASAKTKACSECHDDAVTAKVGPLSVADKSYHVNGVINVKFIDQKIRSKAQVRDEKAYNVIPATPQQGWTLTTELTSNWYRFNGYKTADGTSYDETIATLHQSAADYWDAELGNDFADPAKPEEDYYKTATKTCLVACHLWESGRVDKIIPHWVDDSQANPTVSERLMCIDCHTRLPK